MGLEDLASAVNDFMGDASEGIQDILVDIGEYSKNAVESLGEEGMEALENGDIKGAVDCSDMPEDYKEATKEILKEFGVADSKNLFVSGGKILVGTFGTVAALVTPGFQPSGILAAKFTYDGAKELALALQSRQANVAQANA